MQRGAGEIELASSDGVRVVVLTYGATLRSVSVGGATVVLGFPRAADYEAHAGSHVGSTVGRYANRIAAGRFRLDGRPYELARNEGRHHLHGGPVGFSRRTWTLVEEDHGPEGGRARLGLVSADGDQGYPGELRVLATFTLGGSTLGVRYEATTDAPTIVSLTTHPYWNLAGATGTALDLREPRRVADILERVPHGLDHCYVVDDGDGRDDRPPVAVLFDPASRRWLAIETNQPGLQVYTGNHLGPPFERHAGICLEPQQLPDAPNHRGFPSPVLRPGGRYVHETRFRLGRGQPPSVR